jgi:hypothetical protein
MSARSASATLGSAARRRIEKEARGWFARGVFLAIFEEERDEPFARRARSGPCHPKG